MTEMDRRKFNALAMAALGGVLAGCQQGSTPAGNAAKAPAKDAVTEVALSAEAEALISDEPHVCRGLNTCKGLGRSKENACAGQGTCASVAEHACGGQNECKGQGGCGELPGMNTCKGQGGCHIPLMESVWPKARAAFETALKKQKKDFGPAPAAT